MKNISNSTYLFIAIIFIGSLISACNGSGKTDQKDDSVSAELVTNPITASGKKIKSDLPVMAFKTDKHDFGLIMQGEKVSHTFKFTNEGGTDLLISDASSTCGCTVSTFSREPIKPGETGIIEVVFNSASRSGANYKKVKILTNAQPNTIELTITAEVYVPEK